MKIFVVGSGKLASAILTSDLSFQSCEMVEWSDKYQSSNEKAILVHAGSGRQLKECLEFCRRTDSVFIELSTGLETEKINTDFTLVLCPNTSVLLLKLMNLLKVYGHYFENNKVSIIESHQASKSSVPGTAFSIAQSLNVSSTDIVSVRDSDKQLNHIGIPQEYLDKHAYHKIVIEDGLDIVSIETKVLGHSSYAKGVGKIIDVVLKHRLEKRRYSILELIDANML